MRRPVIASLACLALLTGYGAADVLDVVPGVLTRTTSTPLPEPTGSATGPAPTWTPLPAAGGGDRVLADLPAAAPLPTTKGLRAALSAALADPSLGRSVGVSVRDARTGVELFGVGQDTPRVVASTAKLLTAAVVGQILDLRATMATRVVRGSAGELVLVAGGDTLLARGAGDPDAATGRAGIGDLADQVAAALRGRPSSTITGTPGAESPGATPAEPGSDQARWTLRLDSTYAAGAKYPPGWNPADVAAGYTQGVTMLGFADDRPEAGRPSPPDPDGAVLKALGAALEKRGVTVRVEDSDAAREIPAPADGAVVGEVRSAAYADVLAEALDRSDNALTENLARQANVRQGGDGSFPATADMVTDGLRTLGFDLRGTRLVDTSGLSKGQTTTVALISAVMAEALAGRLPGLADELGRLPVAGLDGTLSDRYLTGPAAAAAGIARAKTGTLTGASGLAGTTVTADDRELTFVIVADAVPPASGTLAARAALDRFVAALTRCGCGT